MTPSPFGRGGFAHHASIRGVDAEGERGCTIRYQVDPQELRRQQRERDSLPLSLQPDDIHQQHTEEHGEYFTDIR